MTTQQLKYFNTVATLENMLRAAEVLHVSQSNLSKSISKLEDELGCKLFIRNGKNIKLNSNGQRFYECSSGMLTELSECMKDLSSELTSDLVIIKIGIAGYFNEISEAIAKYIKKHPEVSFDITENLGDIDPLPDINEYDVLIYPDKRKYERYTGFKLYTEKYYFAVPSSDILAKKMAAGIEDIKQKNIVFIKHPKSFEFVKDLLDALSVRNTNDYYVNTRDMHSRMISEGIACGFVSSGASDIYKNDDRIKLLPITDSRFQREIKIAFKRDKHLSPAAAELKEFIIDYFKIKM